MFGRGKNNVLILVQKIGNRYIETDRIKYKKEDELVSNKKHTIPIPSKNGESFGSGKNSYLFFDLSEKKYLAFEKLDLGLNTTFLDKLFNNKVVGQLAKAIKKSTEEPKTNTDIIKTIMLYGGLILIGYLLGVQFGCGA